MTHSDVRVRSEDPTPSGTSGARTDLAARLGKACWRTGDFALRSGARTDRYFDKFAFNGDPALLRDVAAALIPLLPGNTEVVAGLELGGVPIAAALSLATGLPAAFVRKTRKTYGMQAIAEGSSVAGRRVVVIEDVVSTGGAVMAAAEALATEGAEVVRVCAVVDRGGCARLRELGFDAAAVFKEDELPA